MPHKCKNNVTCKQQTEVMVKVTEIFLYINVNIDQKVEWASIRNIVNVIFHNINIFLYKNHGLKYPFSNKNNANKKKPSSHFFIKSDALNMI